MLKLFVTLWLVCQISITSCNENDQQNKYLKILKSSEERNLLVPVPLNTGNNKNANVLLSSSQTTKRFHRIERDITPKNLFCTSSSDSECGAWENCQKVYETYFETVECSFLTSSHFKLGFHKSLQENATKLIINLGPRSSLLIEKNTFSKAHINSIIINGNENGVEQIEISKNAFNENLGNLPELNITNCHTIIIRENAFTDMSKEQYSEYLINITNSTEVNIFKDAFQKSRFHGFFTNIKDFRPQSKAFYGSPDSRILIVSSKIERLEPLETSLKEFKITNSTIDVITEGAFSVTSLISIIFQYTKIDLIEKQAFTEKLFSHLWEFTGCHIGKIEKNAFDKSGIVDVLIQNNVIDEIEKQAITITAGNLLFTNNQIQETGYGWMEIQSWNNVTVFNNSFYRYDSLKLGKSVNANSCSLDKNYITIAAPKSFNLINKICKIKEVYFNEACSCNFERFLKNVSSQQKIESSYCTIEDSLKHCFNTSIINSKKYYHEVCDEMNKSLNCIKFQSDKKIDDNFIGPNDTKRITKQLIFIIVGVIAILIVLIIILIICLRKFCQKPKTITIPLSQMQTATTLTSIKSSKSFSNDDRLIITQTLEKIKLKQSSDKYDQVYNYTKRLLEGNLTETEKVLTIGEIVTTLGECENSGADFVAFTGILYKHLAPKDDNENDPVYAEVDVTSSEEPMDIYNHRNDQQTVLDHIYAEPHSVQQPLLTNEYSTPLDRNDLGALYSEPITNLNDNSQSLITPYAIGNHCPEKNIEEPSAASSSKINLPDVLNQQSTKPLTNVQKIANNFANNPNFHITLSPNTQRKIPKYTIPIKNQSDKKLVKNDSTASNSSSEHSGGSDITFKMDEVIEYADA